MNDHMNSIDVRNAPHPVGIAPPPRRNGRRSAALAIAIVAVASLLVVVAGVPVISDLVHSDGPGPPPVESTVVALGSLGCDVAPKTRSSDCRDADVARLVDALDPELVLPLTYASVPAADNPTDPNDRVWRRLAPRIRPVLTEPVADTAGVPGPSAAQGRSYYSYDFAGWHLIALNGDCAAAGGCGAGSAQARWLAEDLSRSRAKCTLAYWNKPRFSSAVAGGDSDYDAFWRQLYGADAELVLNAGGGGSYERFARQSPDAVLDVERGIREFVVGTSNSDGATFSGTPLPLSVVRNADTPGVLQLILTADSYRWHFVSAFGAGFRDTGSGTCH